MKKKDPRKKMAPKAASSKSLRMSLGAPGPAPESMPFKKGGKCYAVGGSVDGCASKGKTKGKMV